MKKARLLIADDHPIVAEGLRKLLEPDFELLETVKDGGKLSGLPFDTSPIFYCWTSRCHR